ncbi:MAG TPA: DUF962 domain-containing protein [Pseudomonadota bacterium]|jgi:uncharacterized membrane protein YGL010W|nr:DUF962 domain-containing protein [Pseudomonadota bacterium]HNK44725.1 DUF962 domain-containing protein [Pseudomonadota bacterium]HNN49428.1 DUF962 domain-containing protein [Pseudomonadota bacterium]
MRTAKELLSNYAEYHRDRRNIATHFVGIPMIVFSVAVLLSRLHIPLGPQWLSAATVTWVLTTVFYLSRHLVLGGATSLAYGLAIWFAQGYANGPFSTWISVGVGCFVVGWIIQFIGHYYEGRKPAFVDDLVGFLIGPMFVVAETLFAMGVCLELHEHIVATAGPTRIRDMSRA